MQAAKTVTALFAALLLSAVAAQAQAPKPAQQSGNFPSTVPTSEAGIAAAKPNPQAPGFRIPLPPLDQMEPAFRDEFLRSSEGQHTPIGNRVPLLLSPEVSAAMNQVLPALGKSGLPKDLYQLTILMVAREWDAQFEWWIHSAQALTIGMPEDLMEAIRIGKTPKFANPGQEATYHYLVELLRDHKVSDATYERLRVIIGSRQLVEMTTLAGYYATVAMNLVGPNVPLRADVKPPLPQLANRFPPR